MNGLYVLQGDEPVECSDTKRWGEFMQSDASRVARDAVNGVTVSTVFLGVDCNFSGGTPMLWETMVFKYGEGACGAYRYTTLESARAGHAAMVERYANPTTDQEETNE